MKSKIISTLTCSYDLYDFLLPDYTKLFKKYWKLNTHNVLIGESKTYNSNQFTFLTPGKMRDGQRDLWGKRMLYALEHITTPYVFTMLIDYYLVHTLSKKFINQQVEFLELNKANKIVIDVPSTAYKFSDTSQSPYKYHNNSNYQTTLMPSIWRTDWLRSVINEQDDPWIFETEGTDRIKNQDNHVYLHKCESPIFYNVIGKRKHINVQWGPISWKDLKEKEKLNDYSLNLKNLPDFNGNVYSKC